MRVGRGETSFTGSRFWLWLARVALWRFYRSCKTNSGRQLDEIDIDGFFDTYHKYYMRVEDRDAGVMS